VGIVVVCELEREAARLEPWLAHRPVPARPHLPAREPLARPPKRGVIRGQAGVEERDHRERGVPDGRLARLEPSAVLVVDREAVEARERARKHWVVEAVAAPP